MALADILGLALVGAGLVFFAAGTIGLLRFPDTHSRLHALTKADNLGLGLVALGVALHAPGLLAALKIALVWALALGAAATSAQLIARAALPEDLRSKGS